MHNILSLIDKKVLKGEFDLNFYIKEFNNRKLITFVNPYSYCKLRKNSDLLEKFEIILIDGVLLLGFLKLIGVDNIKRHSFDFSSLADGFFKFLENNCMKVFLIGSSQENIESSSKNLISKYKSLEIIGIRNGYFANFSEKAEFLSFLVKKKPDVVVVGMGTLNQERFLSELSEEGWNGVGITCGGFFHQTKKRLNYYPSVINKLNLRWLYRIGTEPHLFYRYFIVYPVFIILFIKDFLIFRKNSSNI